MNIIPAVDILNGKCVRLLKGNYSDVTIYKEDPIEQVKIFKNAGFKTIHIVDLNAARGDVNDNLKIIQEISNIENIEIQVGGGIRSIEKAIQLLSNNIKKIIVGTAAISDSSFRNQLKNNIDVNKIIFGLDFNLVNDTPLLAVNGWTKNTDINLYDFINNNKWIKNILATDISADGTLSGPNLDIYKNLLAKKSINLIASGGIGSIEDINNLKSILCNECVLGKAIYENKISLKELKNAN